MARVETERYAFRVLDCPTNARKMLQRSAEVCAAADGVLNASNGVIALRGLMNGIKFNHQPTNARFLVCCISSLAEVRARVHDAGWNAQLLATFGLLQLQCPALGTHIGVRRCEVHQVTVVAHQVPLRMDMPAGILNGGSKVGCFLISQRLPLPLSLILGEHLHAIKAKSNRIVNGQMHAASDTEMTANEHLVHLAVLIRKQRKQRCCGACGMDA
jgi:hypothetical protein